jgi:spermidine synthase
LLLYAHGGHWSAFWWGWRFRLVMRILKREVALKELVSQVLTFDYLGALAVSVAFPLLLVPHLGLIRTGLLFGLLNAAVALWALWVFPVMNCAYRFVACAGPALLTLALLAGRLCGGGSASPHWRRTSSTTSRIVLAASSRPTSALWSPTGAPGTGCSSTATCNLPSAMSTATTRPWCTPPWQPLARRARVAVLGGGDGMAVREILKYPSVEACHPGRAGPAR